MDLDTARTLAAHAGTAYIRQIIADWTALAAELDTTDPEEAAAMRDGIATAKHALAAAEAHVAALRADLIRAVKAANDAEIRRIAEDIREMLRRGAEEP